MKERKDEKWKEGVSFTSTLVSKDTLEILRLQARTIREQMIYLFEWMIAFARMEW